MSDGGMRFLRGLAGLLVGLGLLFVAAVSFGQSFLDPTRSAFWLWIALVGLGMTAFVPAHYWGPIVVARVR